MLRQNSVTETFIACKFVIDNWRWAGMPFYLRTGKSMARRSTEIAVRFHQAPFALFRGTDVEKMNPNWMVLRIQPDEGVSLEFAAKRPGPTVRLANVSMDFAYKTYFKTAPNTGYETLIYDCMIGDATLFQRADNIEAGWQAVQPILDVWANDPPKDFPNYASGRERPRRRGRIAGARRTRVAAARRLKTPSAGRLGETHARPRVRQGALENGEVGWSESVNLRALASGDIRTPAPKLASLSTLVDV